MLLNVGAGFDIPTGTLAVGAKGETLVNGGLPQLVGVLGSGNSFKTVILNYLLQSPQDRLRSSMKTFLEIHDTEMTMNQSRIGGLAEHLYHIKDAIRNNPEDFFNISSSKEYSANVWFGEFKKSLAEINKSRLRKKITTPFLDRNGKPMIMHDYYSVMLDSLTMFFTDEELKILEKTDLGDAKGNMFNMRHGLIVAKFLIEFNRLVHKEGIYSGFSLHMGNESGVQSGPPGMMPPKKMQHMKMGTKAKGGSDNVYYLPMHVWESRKSTALKNSDGTAPMFPIFREDDGHGDPSELNLVKLFMIRSKTCLAGFSLDVMVSQNEGVLPSMTEFYTVKKEKFGFEGSDRSYALNIMPGVKLSRTTVRETLDNDPKLRRAMQINCDLYQIAKYHPAIRKERLVMSPIDLYSTIKKKVGWDNILNTRNYWVPNQYDHEIPFLSIVDLLRLAKDQYKPYWMK